MRKSPVCVLFSGGIDSTATVIHYLKAGEELRTLHINYGQVAFKPERAACRRISRILGIRPPDEIDVRKLGGVLTHPLLGTTPTAKGSLSSKFKAEYFPNRNLLLLTLASVFCHHRKIKRIALGIVGGGHRGYHDTKVDFLNSMNALFWEPDKLEVEAPFILWNKQRIVAFLGEEGLDLESTYSCNISGDRACERCASCIERRSSIL